MKARELWPAVRLYLRQRLWAAVFMALCAGVFWLVGFLLGAPPEGVGYAALLVASVALVFACADGARFCRRHAEMQRLLRSRLPSPDALPRALTPAEADWRALAEEALSQRDELQNAYAAESRRRDEHMALWTHQIKVPISAMRLLLQSEPDANSTAMGAELFKIEQYVDMQLGYARLGGPSTDYVLRPCALDGVIRRVARRFAPLFIQRKLALHYEGTNLTVLTDEKWLAFALEQVVSNAVKYTHRGGVTLAVDEEKQTLTIADTGIGIAPEDLPRVFDHGYTGLNGRDDRRATGLGLHLTRQTLHKLGHGISISSEVGRGTRVVFDLTSHPVEAD